MTKLYSLLVFTLIFVSCGEKESTAQKQQDSVNVVVSTASLDSDNRFLSASGKIESVNHATLSTRLMGVVEKIYVNTGDKVKQGQLLIKINSSDLQAKRAQVEASITEAAVGLKNTEINYNRYKNLFEQKSASQKEWDDISSQFEIAKARLEAVKQMKKEVEAQFAYTNIMAPFSGVVTSRFIEEGNLANPGMPLMAIENPGAFEVIASVPESEISEIKSGTEVSVLIKSIGKTVKGEVTEVSPSAINTGGQYLVKVKLDENQGQIRSGMYASVQFPVEKKTMTTAVLIPIEALVTRGELKGVYTVSQQNTALLRWLRLGRTFDDQVEVLSGLNSEETYILSASGKLYNGVKINVQDGL